MKAAYYERFGPARDALQIGPVEDPTPGPGEVLVAMKASGVNPSDVKLRAGARPGGVAAEMPYPRIIPHSDGAGVIEAVGDGVSPNRLGERVWIWNGQWARASGTAAEKMALPSAQAPRLPEPASFAEGACLGIPARTAHYAVYSDGPVEGKTVLVTGGAGAVGHYAVQMARLGGAQVIATVSGPEKAAIAEAAGAHSVINYREGSVVDAVRAVTGAAGVDRIVEVEFGGNLAASVELLAPNGVVAAYASMAEREPALPFYPLMFKNATLRLLVVYQLAADPQAEAERALAGWLEGGRLSHRIAHRLPLSEAAAAHEAVERGDKIGSVILEI